MILYARFELFDIYFDTEKQMFCGTVDGAMYHLAYEAIDANEKMSKENKDGRN